MAPQQVALFNLVEVEPFYKAYRVARPDFVVMVASFAFTLFVNIEVGRQAQPRPHHFTPVSDTAFSDGRGSVP